MSAGDGITVARARAHAGVASIRDELSEVTPRRSARGATTLAERIGDGTVYRATEVERARPVAVKILRASLAAEPVILARFIREARLASQLEHPNLVHVRAYGSEPDGLTYLVMELVEGRELAAEIERGPAIAPARIVSILSQVLDGLAAAHQLGIVHRDLKPENILLVARAGDVGETADVVKLADFGIARVYGDELAEADTITSFGSVAGTPEYMSPEQCAGEELDGRADVYSAGVVLYELLAGRTPFRDESPLEVMRQHVQCPVTPPSRLRPGVDPRIEAVALRALAKSRDERFAGAAAMRDALRAALGLAPVGRSPAAGRARTDARGTPGNAEGQRVAASERPAKRRRAYGALAVIALAAAGVGAWWWRVGPTPSARPDAAERGAIDRADAGAAEARDADVRAPARLRPRRVAPVARGR